jgi:hypothetical protein
VRPPEAVTVADAARCLGLSRRTVQLDVAGGAAGIVRPGAPGPGNGALIDLSEYCAWRARRAGADPDPAHERERAWALLCAAALRTVQDHGGITRQSRQHSAGLLLALLQRMHPLLIGGPLDPVPDQLRILFRILRDSG